MSGCGVAMDPALGGSVSDPALSGALLADPAPTGAVVVESEIDVALGAGQGVAGPPGRAAAQPQTFQILGVSSFNAAHGLTYVPSVRITDPTGAEVDTDLFHSPGQVTAVFPGPFSGTIIVG